AGKGRSTSGRLRHATYRSQTLQVNTRTMPAITRRVWPISTSWRKEVRVLESQPVIHLQENDIRRRALKQRPGVGSEVDLAALQLRRPTARPDEKQRRAGVVLPAEHDIAAE